MEARRSRAQLETPAPVAPYGVPSAKDPGWWAASAWSEGGGPQDPGPGRRHWSEATPTVFRAGRSPDRSHAVGPVPTAPEAAPPVPDRSDRPGAVWRRVGGSSAARGR